MATLFLICGLPGAGKTTLAKQLEQAHQALRFSPDEWIKQIIQDESNQSELTRLRDPVESLQWTTAQKLLSLGVNVILENGFWTRQERSAFRRQAKAIPARVELHFLDVSPAELWRRIERRNLDSSTTSFPITKPEFESWLACFEPPASGELTAYDGSKVYDFKDAAPRAG